MKNVSELVAAPVDKQTEWLQQQPWFVDENFEYEIFEAPAFVLIFPNIQDHFDECDPEMAAHYLQKQQQSLGPTIEDGADKPISPERLRDILNSRTKCNTPDLI